MTIAAAEEVYALIVSNYGPFWPDNKMEKSEAIDTIYTQMKQGNVFFFSKEKIIHKCNLAAQTHATKKCKVSTLIESQFWNTVYPMEMTPKEIKLKRYNPNQR